MLRDKLGGFFLCTTSSCLLGEAVKAGRTGLACPDRSFEGACFLDASQYN